MKDGTGLSVVKEKFPDNFIDVGIAEEYAVTMAGGIASGGAKPVVAIYSTFMQRAYDQILSDVCMQNLPVVFCLDRSGLVGEDGKTHQGVFDLSFLSHLPNITVLAPSCVDELEKALQEGKLEEAWGCGTAAVVSPIGELCYKDQKFVINNGQIGTVTQFLYDTLTGIQWGKIEDEFGWIYPIK